MCCAQNPQDLFWRLLNHTWPLFLTQWVDVHVHGRRPEIWTSPKHFWVKLNLHRKQDISLSITFFRCKECDLGTLSSTRSCLFARQLVLMILQVCSNCWALSRSLLVFKILLCIQFQFIILVPKLFFFKWWKVTLEWKITPSLVKTIQSFILFYDNSSVNGYTGKIFSISACTLAASNWWAGPMVPLWYWICLTTIRSLFKA